MYLRVLQENMMVSPFGRFMYITYTPEFSSHPQRDFLRARRITLYDGC